MPEFKKINKIDHKRIKGGNLKSSHKEKKGRLCLRVCLVFKERDA
jgi:hypothetical protein